MSIRDLRNIKAALARDIGLQLDQFVSKNRDEIKDVVKQC